MWTAYAIGGGAGPIVVGHSFDHAGQYPLQVLLGLFVVAIAAAAVSLLLKNGREPGSFDQVHATAVLSIEE
jgi:hypothetical protein